MGPIREERPLVEMRPGRHIVVSNTLPLLASSGALPLSARNVFAMITKGRGDTGPCFWTSGALSKSRGLPLLVKVKVKFKFKVKFKVKFKLKFKFKVNFKFKVKVKFRVKFKVKVSSSTSSKSSSSSTSRSRSSSSSRSS